ncbi:hypothetical protein QBC47DRAFT_442259 [Echria macrotheca]|uniref:Acetylserotonin methytransferase-like protein n=1 Tax=Echria macrotheca TaxID=438768 RepID=A0AAJ0FDA6_9PEZI|nr:hypothetical protein QBC47DRAFT_442259 [Echria macrotheca]
MSQPPAAGGFSLFPNTSNPQRPPSRTQTSRPRAQTPQGRPSNSADPTPPKTTRQSSVRRTPSSREGKQKQAPATNPWQHALEDNNPYHQEQEQAQQQQQRQQTPQQPQPQRPQPPAIDTAVGSQSQYHAISVADVPPRCDTALSEAKTLVRSPSVSSIAKPPLVYTPAGNSHQYGASSASAPAGPEPALRSMFPQFNPELPLDRQDYYPTQTGHATIPQSAINRPMYSPRSPELPGQAVSPGQNSAMHPAQRPAPTTNHRHHEPPVIPPVSTTEELRSLWKVTNGWKASSLEGRVFCLKMITQPDAPVYTLSSDSSQPFYNLRIDPTSASAYVSLSRYDPNKPFKGPKPSSLDGRSTSTPSPTPRGSTSAKSDLKHDAKHWQEVLITQLEEASRREPPNDGLVAQLWPTAAARLIADRANDATTVALAEHECARLVWDADSGSHFLVHPALAVPFCVTVERNPAHCRTEYTLEHLESPAHLGRLTRDGTGAGWLEVDTSIAAKIDAVYLVDVVVAALVLVAHADDHFTQVEVFEPPPVLFGDGGDGTSTFSGPPGHARRSSRSSRLSRASRRDSRREEKERQREMKRQAPKSRLEQFEMDIESQTSELKKSSRRSSKEKEKVPGLARGIIALLTVTFKCLIWCFTLAFKALTGLVKCLSSDKI